MSLRKPQILAFGEEGRSCDGDSSNIKLWSNGSTQDPGFRVQDRPPKSDRSMSSALPSRSTSFFCIQAPSIVRGIRGLLGQDLTASSSYLGRNRDGTADWGTATLTHAVDDRGTAKVGGTRLRIASDKAARERCAA